MRSLAQLRAAVQHRRDTVHDLEPGGPGGGQIGDPTFAQCQAFEGVLKLIDALPPADHFDLHQIDRLRDEVVFRRRDDRGRVTDVVLSVSQWEGWDRPVTLTAEITPGPVIVDQPPDPAERFPSGGAVGGPR